MIWNGEDLGSVEQTDCNGEKYEFQFLTADFSKLPTDVGAGSSAIDLSTGDVYIFHQQTKTWNRI